MSLLVGMATVATTLHKCSPLGERRRVYHACVYRRGLRLVVGGYFKRSPCKLVREDQRTRRRALPLLCAAAGAVVHAFMCESLTWALAASAVLFLHGEKHSQGSTLVKPTFASDPRDLG